jgi:tRNA threonylcarbamoyladenosine biosynthesis protein TsaB
LPETGRSGPLVLGFDTAAAHCAAALLSGDRILASVTEEMAKGQAERLMGLCEEVLAAGGAGWRDLDALGVGIGPGNFTGIRISVSCARGLALGLGIPAVGVPAFDALRLGQDGPCAVAVDARRGQFYFRRYAPDSDALLCDADALPAHDGPLIGAGGKVPSYPAEEAIARLAAARFEDNPPRPAPLYLRPADAAPARDVAPAILA